MCWLVLLFVQCARCCCLVMKVTIQQSFRSIMVKPLFLPHLGTNGRDAHKGAQHREVALHRSKATDTKQNSSRRSMRVQTCFSGLSISL